MKKLLNKIFLLLIKTFARGKYHRWIWEQSFVYLRYFREQYNYGLQEAHTGWVLYSHAEDERTRAVASWWRAIGRERGFAEEERIEEEKQREREQREQKIRAARLGFRDKELERLRKVIKPRRICRTSGSGSFSDGIKPRERFRSPPGLRL